MKSQFTIDFNDKFGSNRMISDLVNTSLVLVLSYLYGSIPFAFLFAYLKNRKIITQEGTGNVGVINSYAVGGIWVIAFTILSEISKAAVAIALAVRLGDGSLFIQYMALFAAFLGANFSIFLKGKGGKGSTLFVWGQAFINPLIAITISLVAAGLYLLSTPNRNVKKNWLVSIPTVFLVATGDLGYTLYGCISALIMAVRTNSKNDDFRVHGYMLGRKKKTAKHVLELSQSEDDDIGGKGQQLKRLAGLSADIPETFVCRQSLFQIYLSDPQTALSLLKEELRSTIDMSRKYAIRSSANVEDGSEFSFAGQFDSFLNVTGQDEIVEAVEKVWQSAQSDRVKSYCQSNGIPSDNIGMSVLIQDMVDPIMAGVAFSHNPLSGLHEIVIEAVEGLGDALVQGSATPERWSWKWGDWLERPEESALDAEAMKSVARKVEKLWKSTGTPIDIEWAFDGHNVICLQMRDMTGVEETNLYSNRLSKEFLPGAIKPLIWSINIPLVNTAWVRFISEVTGPSDIDPITLARSFYYRAYFNMGVFGRIFEQLGFPPDGVEQIAGLGSNGPDKPAFRPTIRTLPLAPRMIACTWDKLRFERKAEAYIKTAKPLFQEFAKTRLDGKSDQEILEDFDRLYAANQEAAYFNVVTPLLNLAYHAGLNRKLKPFEITIDTLKDYAEAASIDEDEDPNAHLGDLNTAFMELSENAQIALKAGGAKAFGANADPEVLAFKTKLDSFMDRFGHFSDSGNDFSVAPWREDLDLIINMVVNFARADGRASDRIALDSLPFKGLERRLVNWLLRKSLIFKGLRDEVSSIYTFGYGLFRNHFEELGHRLVVRNIIATADDIYYLSLNEIRSVIIGGELLEPAKMLAQKRRQEMAKYDDVDSAMPQIIYGDDEPVLRQDTGNLLEGLPTSGGLYTGNVCVVRGIQDFQKVETGDILVVPYSDVGWTPLFAKAGAIIAESGGMLSHSSIVAREYHIPAVVSVIGAGRLSDGDIVTIDGQQGLIRIEQTALHRGIGSK